MMKQGTWINILIVTVIVLIISAGCKKEETISTAVVVSFLVSEVTSNSAVCGGEVTSGGGSAISSRGVCWNTFKHPVVGGSHTTDSSGTGIFTSSITALKANTQYFLRAYATNSVGTAYGKEMVFSTRNTLQISDVDGNVYNTIILGTQTWLTEDLRTTRYNDGSVIPTLSSALAWSESATAAYCWYNNDSLTNKDIYGALYNWHTVNTGKLCPAGWHVPSDSEWKTIEIYLDMNQTWADSTGFRGDYQGIEIRNTTGWNSRGTSSNSSGFSAMPGGSRNPDGSFEGLGNGNNWWSSTGSGTDNAWKRGMYYSYGGVFRGFYAKSNGYSVRCLKND